MSAHLAWFRLYAESVDDEKLRLLAFEDRWHFVALLCCKCQGVLEERNAVLMRRKAAVKLGLQMRELDEVSRRLAEVGLVDAETLQPCAWAKRQFLSDNSTDRVRRHREKKKKQGHGETETDVTFQERFRNGSVTPPETEQSSVSIETEREAKASLSPDASLSDDSKARCPHREIIALYHDRLEELPCVVVSRWAGSRAERDLRARWNEDRRHRSLDFWERFFAVVRSNPHWMGNNDRSWKADLRWLVRRANFDKVIDRMVTTASGARHG